MLRGRSEHRLFSEGHMKNTSILFQKTTDRRLHSKTDTVQFYLPPSSPILFLWLSQSEPRLLSTSWTTRKGNLLSVTSSSFSFSSLRATFIHLPQGLSPTAYLLHQISQPSDGNTEQRHNCDLSLLLPWQPVLPLKLSSLQPWRPAMTLDLLPNVAQTCSLPKLYLSMLVARTYG